MGMALEVYPGNMINPKFNGERIEQVSWDVIVVGAGHNGLTTAAYLAKAGKRVVVLEQRNQIGGSTGSEQPWPGVTISTCSYMVGLLHPRICDDLDLFSRGLHLTYPDPQLYVPIEPGIGIVDYLDPDRTWSEMSRWAAPSDVKGFGALVKYLKGIRSQLRPLNDDDLWLHEAPTREMIADRVGNDSKVMHTLYEQSFEELVGGFIEDRRILDAIAANGIIGTNASPKDPGTAFIKFHHASGGLAGPSVMTWAFPRGGTIGVAEAIRKAAVANGARIETGAAVRAILPREGVEMQDGRRIKAPVVASSADPRRTFAMVDAHIPHGFGHKVDTWPMVGTVGKVNFALTRLPVINGFAESAQAMVDLGSGMERLHQSHRATTRGQLGPIWAELYPQTAYDTTVAPRGVHVLSCFVQHLPYSWADGGTWDDHRERVGQRVTSMIEEWSPGFSGTILHQEVVGPPDIEAKTGLTGGHIFQGDHLPSYAWDQRMPYRTPVDGVYLCGASTHPGGSIIAACGRNAALRILADSC
jgi:phytoene dehydrogenase-like protein